MHYDNEWDLDEYIRENPDKIVRGEDDEEDNMLGHNFIHKMRKTN